MKLIDENGKLIHIDSSEDILLHYGKKGMKWGVRSSLRNIKQRWNNLPERRRRQIKALSKVAAVGLGTVALGYAARKAFFTKEPLAWENAPTREYTKEEMERFRKILYN